MNAQQLIDRVQQDLYQAAEARAEIEGEWGYENRHGGFDEFAPRRDRDFRVAVTLEEAEALAAEGYFG